jgi:hypothetical protein
MPCYLCGARQVDPVRGHSPWQRGVRRNQQILVCPDCQATSDWTADLDHCGSCGSARLVRRLGEVECRACGRVHVPEQAPGEQPVPPGGQPEELAEEVALALERMFGRPGGQPQPPSPAPLPQPSR